MDKNKLEFAKTFEPQILEATKDWLTYTKLFQAMWNQANAFSGHVYSGSNSLALSAWQIKQKLNSALRATWLQVKASWWHIKQGKKMAYVIFSSPIVKTNKEWEIIDDYDYKKRFSKKTHVINLDDCEGIDPSLIKAPQPIINDNRSIDELDVIANDYIQRSGLKMVESNNGCFYRPKTHEVHMVDKKHFKDSMSYYAVLFHELVHSTAFVLNRRVEWEVRPYGSPAYTKEEIVAEFGASIILSKYPDFNVTDRMAYMVNWLKKVPEDKKPEYLYYGANEWLKADNLIVNWYKNEATIEHTRVESQSLEIWE